MILSPRTPQHVAIIMDGNGRWAQSRGHIREFGHVRGTARVIEIVRAADEMGVKALTLFAFSTENWTRPENERSTLWKLLIKFLNREIEELDRNNVRLRVIGEPERLIPEAQEVLNRAIDRLSKNTGLNLTFALSYGARAELARASRLFAEDCVKGVCSPGDMSDELMNQYLYTQVLGEWSNVDLVIRTSGEKRISNFLLWQSAYAEYVFVDECWPEFGTQNFKDALNEYSSRERRFGGVKTIEPRRSRFSKMVHSLRGVIS